MNRTTQWTYLGLVTVMVFLFLAGCSSPTPTLMSATATDSEFPERGTETGVDELDRVIQIVQEGDMNALRSLVRYTQAECTFEDGLGGPPKCKEGEVEGETVEVLPFFGPEGHEEEAKEVDEG